MRAGPVLHATLLKCTMPLPGAVLGPSPLLLPRDGLLLGALRLLALLLGRLGTLCLLLGPLLLRLLGPLLLLLRLLGPLLLLLRLLSPLLLLLRLLSSLLLLLRLLSPLLLPLRLLGPLLLLLRLLSSLLLLLRLLSPLLLPLRLLGPLLLLLRLLSPLLLLLRLLGPLLLWLLSCRLALFFLLIALRVGRVNRPEKHEQGSGTDNSNKLHRNRSPLISLLSVHADDQSAPNDVPPPRPPRPQPWSCAPSHPGGWAESRAYTASTTPSSTY